MIEQFPGQHAKIRKCLYCLDHKPFADFTGGSVACKICTNKLMEGCRDFPANEYMHMDYDNIVFVNYDEPEEEVKPAPKLKPIRRTAGRKRQNRWNANGDLLCTKCGRYKPTTEFHREKRTSTGYAQWCRPCYREYHRRKK